MRIEIFPHFGDIGFRDPGQHFKLELRVARDDTGRGCGFYAAHGTGVRHNHALYVLDDVGTYGDFHLFRQCAEGFARQCRSVGESDGLRTSHCGYQLFFQYCYIAFVCLAIHIVAPSYP